LDRCLHDGGNYFEADGWPLGPMVSFMIFTASIRKILDQPSYLKVSFIDPKTLVKIYPRDNHLDSRQKVSKCMQHTYLLNTSQTVFGFIYLNFMLKIKVKYNCPYTGLEKNACRISRQYAHEGCKVVTPTPRPTLHSGNTPGTHLLEAESTPWP